MRIWLDDHPSEIVVLNFGNIEMPEQTIPVLIEALFKEFNSNNSGSVQWNKSFKESGTWPTLGEAVQRNERVFIFIRDNIGAITKYETGLVKEFKVKPGRDIESKNVTKYDVTVMTAYKAKSVGDDCSFVLETSDNTCKTENATRTNFLKLSPFSKFGKGGAFGTECVHKMARKCNQWIKQIVENCDYRVDKPNFVLVDYPNYLGGNDVNIVEIFNEINIKRSLSVLMETNNLREILRKKISAG